MSHEQRFAELHGALEGEEKAYMVKIEGGLNPFKCLSHAIPQGARAAYADGVLYVKAVEFSNPEAVELQV